MEIDNQIKYYKDSASFNLAYNFWLNNLFERASRLFVWENTGTDETGGIDASHLENYLLLGGNVGIMQYNKQLTAFLGTYSGVSVYYNRFPYYCVRSPLYSGIHKIGEDIIVIRNNANENSIQHLVHRYAVMLAHAEITLITLLVNARVTSVPTVRTLKEKAIVDAWRSGLYNGKINTVLDSGFLSVKWNDINSNNSVNIKDIMEVRENLLNSFYNDIGVRTTWNKKGNMIADEVGGNDSMLLLNINDMLQERQAGCERVNNMFGTSWTVDKCEELKYNNTLTIDAPAVKNKGVENE